MRVAIPGLDNGLRDRAWALSVQLGAGLTEVQDEGKGARRNHDAEEIIHEVGFAALLHQLEVHPRTIPVDLAQRNALHRVGVRLIIFILLLRLFS